MSILHWPVFIRCKAMHCLRFFHKSTLKCLTPAFGTPYTYIKSNRIHTFMHTVAAIHLYLNEICYDKVKIYEFKMGLWKFFVFVLVFSLCFNNPIQSNLCKNLLSTEIQFCVCVYVKYGCEWIWPFVRFQTI